MLTKNQVIDQLNLQPHPEGGYFRETYRSEGLINSESLKDDYKGPRNYSTCIYFLLTSESFSAFHRILQDESWHFYMGSPILLHTISKDGVYEEITIGNELLNGQIPQFVVKGGLWFAAEIVDSNAYSLIGCTVAPGFSFNDFELGSRNNLLIDFPEHTSLIMKLTRD